VLMRGKVCSDPDYTDQFTCETSSPRWMRTIGACSDPQYTDQTSCELGILSWNDLVINSDPVINDAILLGIAGNYVYCSDCHHESVLRYDKGTCSDPSHVNDIECEFSCNLTQYTTQVDCLANGGSWNQPTGDTWTDAGYCNDIRFSDENSCVTGGEPIWFTATQACSDPQYITEQECNDAISDPVWNLVMPYSIHDKYNGVGIYSFSERHHEAEIWTGTCSIGGITDEDECYNAVPTPGIWTPTFTPGNTFVGNGDCTACHKDPREQPYDRSVCEDTSYADAASCIGAGLAVYGGSCSNPEYLNTYDCTDNGGSWSGGICLDYQKDQASCTGGSYSWITHPAGASKALPMPKQLPCVVCHADVDAVGKTLTIYKEKTNTQVDPFGTYGGWTLTPSGHIVNTVLHGCAHDNQAYSGDEALCNSEPDHSWYEPLGVCFDETYTDRASCDAAANHHWETPCSDNQYDDEHTCNGYCSYSQYLNESECTTYGHTWKWGTCLDYQYSNEPDCTTNGGTWTGSLNHATWEGTQHQWNINGGNIQDYGACIFCHKMRPFHAYPGPPADDQNTGAVDQDYSDGFVDPPHYPVPGRGHLAVFFGKHRKPFKYYAQTGQSGNKSSYKAIRDDDALPDNSISWWANVIYDPQADPTGMVPTADYCSDPAITDETICENAGHWWHPGHRMGEPEHFTIPTFDSPSNDPLDAITIQNGTGYSSRDLLITVEATTNTSSTGGGTTNNKIYAIWGGITKPMVLDSSSGGIDTWLVTFTAADGVFDVGDSTAGRVYVISVDEGSDNHDLLYQVFTDL